MGEAVQKGTFEWRIENFMKKKLETLESPGFVLGRNYCVLRIYGRSATCSNCITSSSVYLKCDYGFNRKTFYQLSLIAHDEEFLLSKRTCLKETSSFLPLTIIEDFEMNFQNRKYLPEGALNLRLSWCEGEHPKTKPMSDLASEMESTKCLETLSSDLYRLYESKRDTDCMLRAGETQFPVHHQILSARSEVFGAMFRHDTSESRSGIADIPDVDEAVLGHVLHYIYTGEIRELTSDTVVPMFVAADKYALIEMRSICLDLLKSSLTVENICEAALLAHTHEVIELENKVVKFIEDKLEELEDTDEWQNFLKDIPLLANKLLRSALMASKNKESSAK